MDKDRLEYRMYGLVPYNISPIQQGIQFAHGLQEYNNDVMSGCSDKTQEFITWANKDKTVIILNGGTTNKFINESSISVETHYKGTINTHEVLLKRQGIKTACFYEPDLGDQLTAVVFLVDERVWDKEKYPDLMPTNGLIKDITLQRGYKEWVDSIGGETNAWLREFLKQFRLV